MQARVAKSIRVSRAMVCMVMAGKKTSARVSKAIDREIARIEREIAKSQERAA
jgi:predicted transcriptional regulator